MRNTSRTRVLVTNDDGIHSENMRAMALALSRVADVFVFAPETEQSGVGQSFTVRKGLRILPVEPEPGQGAFPYQFYSVSGTPADCSKFALGHFSRHGMSVSENDGPGVFDVCFSGINIGENSGVSSLYSGTVAGAREAALWNVPGIALSLRGTGSAMLQTAIDFAVTVVQERIFESILPGTFWNVNFPKTTPESFRGYRGTSMALGMFTDHYDHKDGLWFLDGDKLWDKAPVDSDDYLLNQGYATITAHGLDQTDCRSFEKINKVINKKIEEGGW